MSNFCLLNQTIERGDYNYSVSGMLKLASISKEKEDAFYKHESIYSLVLYSQLCENLGANEQILLIFLEQLSSMQANATSVDDLADLFPNETNVFLGINFEGTQVPPEIQITDDDSYKQFNKTNLWNVTFKNFWGKREKLFPNLVFCPQVKDHVYSVGGSSHFNQIVERLKEFDRAVSGWTQGIFSYKQINSNYSLRISPESDGTMSKFGNERIFPMPTGGTEYFELHIKTGGLRFHFYAQNTTRLVFIGYIGPHLSTVSN